MVRVKTPGGAEPKKARMKVPKSVRNAALSAGILLVLMVVGGVVYVYLGDQTPAKDLSVAAPAATVTAKPITPRKPAPDAKESAAIEMLTSPVKAGSNASVSVRTEPGSACNITVLYNKIASTDSGLVAKTADDYGSVSWAWTVGTATPRGTWPATVTCAYHGRTAVVEGDVTVTN